MKKQQARRIGTGSWMLAVVAGIGMIGAAVVAAPVPVVGDWNGALSSGGGSLRVAIHVTQDKDGHLIATMDSLDQGAMGIAITSITYKEPALHFEIEKFGASYDGTINKDNSEITGNWKQNGLSLPLAFKRTGK